jgi:hypothetical protein
MGREHFLAPLLDRVACWLSGPLPRLSPGLAGAAAGGAGGGPPGREEVGPLRVSMSKEGVRPWTRSFANQGLASVSEEAPGIGAGPADPHDTPVRCNQFPHYRGMHGRPCRFVKTGTDALCPKGTQAGLFWTYKINGVVYCYVDCCGRDTTSKVWCNWVKEQNWCGGKGATAGLYTCTLSIPKSNIRVGSDGFPTGLEQPGAPPLDASGQLPGQH